MKERVFQSFDMNGAVSRSACAGLVITAALLAASGCAMRILPDTPAPAAQSAVAGETAGLLSRLSDTLRTPLFTRDGETMSVARVLGVLVNGLPGQSGEKTEAAGNTSLHPYFAALAGRSATKMTAEEALRADLLQIEQNAAAFLATANVAFEAEAAAARERGLVFAGFDGAAPGDLARLIAVTAAGLEERLAEIDEVMAAGHAHLSPAAMLELDAARARIFRLSGEIAALVPEGGAQARS